LVEHVDTTSEQLIDDLAARVKQIILRDWFQESNLVFKGGAVQFSSMYKMIG
jgi:hypothetical protein